MDAKTDRNLEVPSNEPFDGAVSSWDPWLVAMLMDFRRKEGPTVH